MKAANLRENTEEELLQMIEDTRKALSELKVKSIIGDSAEEPTKAKQYRRDIARIKTVLNQRSSQDKGSE